MNSICFFKDDFFDDKRITFNDKKRLGHIHTHLNSKIGDCITITVVNKGIYKAKIENLDENSCALIIDSQLESKDQWFHLLVGLSRPQTIKKVLEHSTTLGASSITLFKAQLSEKSYSQSKLYQDENFKSFLIDGLSQSKTYSSLPDFSLLNYLNLDKYKNHKNKFFLTLNTKQNFTKLDREQLVEPLLAIGPERGWTKAEEDKLLKAGFNPIQVSRSTLRVEHAVYTSVGQLELLSL